MTLNHVLSKSLSIPPVRPNVMGCSPKSAFTSSKRKAVLKYYTAKVTLVVISSFSVSVGYEIQATSKMQAVLRM